MSPERSVTYVSERTSST